MYLFAWTESGSNTDTGSPRYNRHKLGVKICGKENCMVLLPDNWDETVISLTNFASQMEYNENSAPTWAEMAEAGAVCLPAAGQRHGPEVTECDSKSYYWSSSAADMSLIGITDDAAAYVTFDGSEVWVGAYPGFYGYSVRLVTESSDGYSPTEKVTGVSLNKNATTIKVGAQETLVATVLPANAANKDVIWSSNNVDVAIVDNTGKVTAVSPGTAVISVVADGFFSATCTVTVQPADILCGTFKVGNYSYVRFAPGNLQAIWDGSAYRWFFAANQFDCIGDASGNRTIDSPSVGDIVDLFGWSTPATNFGISTSSRSGFDANDYSGVFKDWGIAHGNSNGLLEDYEQWRTLSRDEWVYLLGPAIENFGTDFPDKPYRENAENLCSIATVCGKVCLVVAPDYCTDEEFDKNKTTYSATEWADAEANGIVCIAITCARYGNEVENESWANYWTSTSQTDYTAEYLYFKINDSSPIIKTQRASRVCGYSVRLVRDTF